MEPTVEDQRIWSMAVEFFFMALGAFAEGGFR